MALHFHACPMPMLYSCFSQLKFLAQASLRSRQKLDNHSYVCSYR